MIRRSFLTLPAALVAFGQDVRNINTGSVIPDEFYADQPYVVKTNDGAWLCVITTGSGHEGEGGQHVVSMRSTDRGKTWDRAVDVEPASGPEASYAVMMKAPGGRVYVFYNHNTDNLRSVIGDKPAYPDGLVKRVDSQGHFVFKYSDDHGRSWSAQRYEIPQRDFEIDLKNAYGGKVKFFWTVGKAFAHRGAGYVPLHKVGGFGEGFFTSSEGVLLRSSNLLTERDASRIVWETWPEGVKGIRTPEGGGPIAEEHSFSVMSDGSLFCVFRTIDGHPACTYSRDDGRSWEPSAYMRFASGRLMKHPRAANFAWRCENGKYLYWFHNHGGRFIREHARRRSIAYEERNPVWLCGGVEVDGPRGKVVSWSEPEIALYDDDPMVRMSYPDLIEDGGVYYLTETQKDVARVHAVDPALLNGLWEQGSRTGAAGSGLLLWASGGGDLAAPEFPLFVKRSRRADYGTEHTRAGVSLDVWFEGGSVLVENFDSSGRGFWLQVVDGGRVELTLNDGRVQNRWASDAGTVVAGKMCHAVVIVDGGPNVIAMVMDGRVCDGGEERQFGWGRFHPALQSLNGGAKVKVGAGVKRLLVYGRALRTSEAIASWRAAGLLR